MKNILRQLDNKKALMELILLEAKTLCYQGFYKEALEIYRYWDIFVGR